MFRLATGEATSASSLSLLAATIGISLSSRTSYSLLSALIIAVCTRGRRSPPPPSRPLQGSLPRSSARVYGLPAAESKTTHCSSRGIKQRNTNKSPLALCRSISHGREFALCLRDRTFTTEFESTKDGGGHPSRHASRKRSSRPLLLRRLHFHTAPRQMSQHGPRALARSSSTRD